MNDEQAARVDAVLSHRPRGGTRKPPNDAVLIIRINEALRERFARQAFVAGLSVSEAVRVAMEQWMVGKE